MQHYFDPKTAKGIVRSYRRKKDGRWDGRCDPQTKAKDMTKILPTADKGTVKLGGMAPVLRPAVISDNGKVKLGGMSPMLRG